jgi:hypothetical protein
MNPDKAYRELYQYEKNLREKGLYPIKIPLEGAVKYAPSGSIAQVRVHNYCEPFKHPALRTEVLGVTPDGCEKVLCRYEEERVSDEFSNEVFDVPQVFNYIGENFEEYAEPWTVVYLPKIVDTSVYMHHETFRYEGLHLMLPVF